MCSSSRSYPSVLEPSRAGTIAVVFGVETLTLYEGLAILVPAGLALRLFLREHAARRRAAAAPAPEHKVRDPSDLSAGPAIYKVRVVSEGRANLGTSLETAEKLTGSPDLVAQPVTVETEAGVRLTLRGGAPLKVHSLGGARRDLVESITTEEGGIRQRFSFEVDASTWFLLEGAMPDSASGHPWRTAAIHFMPAGEGEKTRYAINPPAPPRREFTSTGCLAYPVSVGGVAAVLSAELTFWVVVAWVLWGLGVLLLLLGAAMARSEFPEQPPQQPTPPG
jgi:hypothetical protein